MIIWSMRHTTSIDRHGSGKTSWCSSRAGGRQTSWFRHPQCLVVLDHRTTSRSSVPIRGNVVRERLLVRRREYQPPAVGYLDGSGGAYRAGGRACTRGRVQARRRSQGISGAARWSQSILAVDIPDRSGRRAGPEPDRVGRRVSPSLGDNAGGGGTGRAAGLSPRSRVHYPHAARIGRRARGPQGCASQTGSDPRYSKWSGRAELTLAHNKGAPLEISTIRTPGLGDNTFVVVHDGQAIVVDPQRDIDRFLFVLDQNNAELRYVLETHIHNDYVSGGRELAERTGAELVLPASGAVKFDHLPAFHTEAIESGNLVDCRPIHTPGHTPEHLSYLAVVDGEPVAVFSGGSLLVGSAGGPICWGWIGLEHWLICSTSRSTGWRRCLMKSVSTRPTGPVPSARRAWRPGPHSTIGAEKAVQSGSAVPGFGSVCRWPACRPPALSSRTTPTWGRPISRVRALAPQGDLPEMAVADIGGLCGGRRATGRTLCRRPLRGSVGIPFGDQVGVWAGWVLPFDCEIVWLPIGIRISTRCVASSFVSGSTGSVV